MGLKDECSLKTSNNYRFEELDNMNLKDKEYFKVDIVISKDIVDNVIVISQRKTFKSDGVSCYVPGTIRIRENQVPKLIEKIKTVYNLLNT